MLPTPENEAESLKSLIEAMEADCATMLAPVRERMVKRLKIAYWRGVSDGLMVNDDSTEELTPLS